MNVESLLKQFKEELLVQMRDDKQEYLNSLPSIKLDIEWNFEIEIQKYKNEMNIRFSDTNKKNDNVKQTLIDI